MRNDFRQVLRVSQIALVNRRTATALRESPAWSPPSRLRVRPRQLRRHGSRVRIGSHSDWLDGWNRPSGSVRVSLCEDWLTQRRHRSRLSPSPLPPMTRGRAGRLVGSAKKCVTARKPMTRGCTREPGGIAPAIGFALHGFHHGKHLAADTQRPLYSRVWLKEILGKIPAPVGNRKTPAM